MISGEQFNNEMNGKRFVKLTVESNVHNGVTYEEGLNTDPLEFNPINKCVKGGLYFCPYDGFARWTEYKEKQMYYIWEVSIPHDAKVYVMSDKIKSDKFILSDPKCIWENYELSIQCIKYKSSKLKYVKKQEKAKVEKDGSSLNVLKK